MHLKQKDETAWRTRQGSAFSWEISAAVVSSRAADEKTCTCLHQRERVSHVCLVVCAVRSTTP